MTYLTERNGGRIAEVPICFRDRTLGRSKMSSRIVVEAFVLVTWWGVRDRCAGSATPVATPASPECDTEGMDLVEFTVAGALVESAEGLLLVRNQRRNGATDWSTPGGVIDATDASLLHGLAREVEEETGLLVTEWEGPLYEVRAVAPELGWAMRCEVHRALATRATLRIDDPDGIVVDACFALHDRCVDLLDACAQWVREPLADWLDAPLGPRRRAARYAYDVLGASRDALQVVRTDP